MIIINYVIMTSSLNYYTILFMCDIYCHSIDTHVRKNLVLATLTFKKVDFSYTNFENFGVLIVVIHVPKEIPDLRCELIHMSLCH